MIPTIAIKHNFPGVQRQLKQLHEDVALRATTSAVNKVLAQAKTRMSRAITAEYNIKASVVKEGLRVKGAVRKGGLFAIEGFLESPAKRGRSRNLIHFMAKQTPLGVMVKVKRNGPAKLIRHAFIINKGNQYGGTVMVRLGKQRLPIKSKQTIDIQQMFNAKRVNTLVVDFMKTKFPEVFANEARFFTDRFNRGKA